MSYFLPGDDGRCPLSPRAAFALLRLSSNVGRMAQHGRAVGVGDGRGMEEREFFEGRGFWPVALLWLPAGVAATVAVRFGAGAVPAGGALPRWIRVACSL